MDVRNPSVPSCPQPLICIKFQSLASSSSAEHQNPRKTLAFLLLLILLSSVLLQTPRLALSQPLRSSQSPPPPPSPTGIATKHHPHLRRVLLGVLLGVLAGLLASLLLLLSVRAIVLFASRTPILRGAVVFSPQIPPKSLQAALSAQLPAGDCFQLSLDDGLVVAVKRLELDASSAKPNLRRAQRELELLARARHANVMSLKAYSRGRDRLFLVYDYIPNGRSLEDAMKRVRAGQLALGWEARHRIAVGVAKGLRYLHFECRPRILHGRLRPANVVLDEEEGFDPRLAHCGLGRLEGAACGGSDVPSSECYAAPECYQSCRYTDKSDIFSFGMIFGVLLTGRDPLDPFFSCDSAATSRGGGGGLSRWLRHLQQAGETREALDRGILGDEVVEEDMLMAVRIALVCLSDLPADRPSSDELVAMLSQLHSF